MLAELTLSDLKEDLGVRELRNRKARPWVILLCLGAASVCPSHCNAHGIEVLVQQCSALRHSCSAFLAGQVIYQEIQNLFHWFSSFRHWERAVCMISLFKNYLQGPRCWQIDHAEMKVCCAAFALSPWVRSGHESLRMQAVIQMSKLTSCVVFLLTAHLLTCLHSLSEYSDTVFSIYRNPMGPILWTARANNSVDWNLRWKQSVSAP